MPVFRQVLEAVQPLESGGDDGVLISGIAYDSRRVRPGDLFVAIRGLHQDGHHFIANALQRGAAAVLVEDADTRPLDVPYGVVASGRQALAHAAAMLHGYPGRRLRMVGITGTDGKTTTAHLTAAILEAAGHRVGVISTVAVQVGGLSSPNDTGYTTPQAPELQAILAKMVAANAEYAVVEVSSHALALDRVTGCEFDVAVFTNLTPEHLEFHGSLTEYRRQKTRLFEMIERGTKGTAKAGVVNADDASAVYMAEACPVPVVSYGLENPADVMARSLRLEADRSCFVVSGPFGEVELQTWFAGCFNVYNWLAAIAAGFALGATPRHFVAAASTARPLPGRLQRIDLGQPFGVVVDFAHTPNALAQALETLRSTTAGRLIVLFGQAGGRDRRNRPLMGEVVGRRADLTIVTSDDPYDDAPEVIIEEIARGLENVGRRLGQDYYKVLDRREAIALALELARPGDTVLLAGRGHEQYTTIRGQRVPLDDVEQAREWLRRRSR